MTVLRSLRLTLTFALLCHGLTVLGLAQDSNRDAWQQPEAIMDSIGIRAGMAIGEAGAGSGYFTFHLSRRVGSEGRILANDISTSALEELQERISRESVTNISVITGDVDDPKFPEDSLDMVVMMNAFHEFTEVAEWMHNVLPSLKPGATLVIIDRDPDKTRSGWSHFKTKEQILEAMENTGFTLVRILSFLSRDTILIFRPVTKP